jgi:DNA-binding transcriptional MocR family regulator
MDVVERYVSTDPMVKGIWCVPKYSNPQGVVYSDEVVRRFAALKPAANDFRIFWDNAYAVHHLYEEDQAEIPEILEECEKAGNPDIVLEFCSTSKVTFPGSGIAALAASENNLNDIKNQLTFQTIGHDKLNQMRHVMYFGDIDGLKSHMAQQAALIRPKFEMLNELLTKEIAPRGLGSWVNPKGGYFICFESLEGCAKQIVAKCKEAGVTMTGAGAPFPYGKDPKDNVIRIAPTFPSLKELTQAAEVFVTVVRMVSAEKILQENE